MEDLPGDHQPSPAAQRFNKGVERTASAIPTDGNGDLVGGIGHGSVERVNS